jgi:hypothetical protein
MEITMNSIIDKKDYTMDINITVDQLERINRRFITGEHIQTIVPDLPMGEREFLISGITPEEWKNNFGSFEVDDDDPNLDIEYLKKIGPF